MKLCKKWMKQWTKCACLICLLPILLVGCSRQSVEPSPNGRDSVQVVATIFPLADWARQVGGSHVVVTTLLPPGSSAHTFEPAPREMRLMSSAQLLVTSGLHLDDWVSRLKAAGPKSLTVLPIGDQLNGQNALPDVEHVAESEPLQHENQHESHDHRHEGVNPHFWLDPLLAAKGAKLIAHNLAQIDPTHAQEYSRNAEKYVSELEELNRQIAAELAPCKQRAFVSFHNAYPYLAARYGLRVAGVIEEYPGKAPSDRYLKDVINKIKSLGVRTVFAEPQFNARAAEIIAREVGGTVDFLDPYGDTSLPDRDSFVKLMRYNSTKLRGSLCR